MIQALRTIVFLSAAIWVAGVASAGVATPKAQDLERVMWAELNAWYPRCVDEKQGGFIASFDDDWTPLPAEKQSKGLVFQARMTWLAAEVGRRRPGHRERFAEHARHGLAFLRDAMWDDTHGGFFWELDRNGQPVGEAGASKHIYGQAFAVYAAANVYRLTEDDDALELAQRAYRWLEEHAADAEYGGYVEALDRAGEPIPPTLTDEGVWATDNIGTAFGYKSMNTHIHLLEAYTALYRVWPDEQLRGRLAALLRIVAGRVYTEPGCLNLFFTADWTPVPDHDSFGHDVETTYLLLEAAEALGHDAVAAVRGRAMKLTAHAWRYGYDRQRGGLYDQGTAFRPATDTTKVWWAQAEALNAFHLMATLAEDPAPYAEAFAQTWVFTAEHLIDAEHGGWWWSVTASGLRNGQPGKGNNWKSGYHTVRALLEITDRMADSPWSSTPDH